MNSRFCPYISDISDSSTGEILQSDLILPCQYFDICRGHRLSGEQRLMLALLTDAIDVYQKGFLSRLTRDRMLYIDAELWFMEGRAVDNVFSFETVCDALGISPRMLRQRLIAWKHQVAHEAENRLAPQVHSRSAPRRRITDRYRRPEVARAV